MSKRADIVAFCEWGIKNAAPIHYAEIRPIPHVNPGHFPKLPFTTDCSGFATMAYQYANAPDPNGMDYCGQGFTGYMLKHGKKVQVPRPGDLIVFGNYPGHHVVIYMETWRGAYVCCSHGQEVGPIRILLAQEKRSQPAPVTFLSYIHDTIPAGSGGGRRVAV
jgi:hypothetical protein